MNVHPFVSEGKLSTQKLRVSINDFEVGDFDIRVTSSLECLLPWNLLKGGSTVSVKFVHPFAAARSAVTGEPDERLIALAFQRLSLRKLQDADDDGGLAVPPTADHAAAIPEGHVDIYGYYPASRCWLFVGWVSQLWADEDVVAVTARFGNRRETGSVITVSYDRPGLLGRGKGFVLAMHSRPSRRQRDDSRLAALRIDAAELELEVNGHGKAPATTDELTRVLRPILRDAAASERLATLLGVLPADIAADLAAHSPVGHIDLVAYDRSAGGWLFLGWLSHPWAVEETVAGIARFSNREVAGDVVAAFFDRPDVRDRGQGFLLYLRDDGASETSRGTLLLSLQIETANFRSRLDSAGLPPVSARDAMAAIQPLLDGAGPDSNLGRFRSILAAPPPRPVIAERFEGHIDFYGYCSAVEGWLFCGWVTSAWPDDQSPVLVAQFGDGDVSGNALATFYHRDEIVGRGVGVVFLLAAGNDNREPLLSLELEFREFTAALRVSDRGADDEAALLQALRPILFDGELQPDRGGLRSLLFGKPETPQAVVPVPASIARGMSGHVDFYGYHPQAQVWLFCGWVAAPWSDSDKPTNVVARFSNGLASGDATLAAFYYRDDIQAQGVGFILSLASADGDRNHLAGLELEFAETTMLLPTTAAGPGLTAPELTEWLTPLLAGGEANSNRSRLQALLQPANDAIGATVSQGFVDFYGYHAIAGGWLFCGWISGEAEDAGGPLSVTAHFERGSVRDEAVVVRYRRGDLGDSGIGIVLFVAGSGNPPGGLLSLEIEASGLVFRVYPGVRIQRLRELELVSNLRGIVAAAPAGGQREVMLAILGRQGYAGTDTVGELIDRIFLELDEAIFCEPDAVVLIGWYLAKPGVVRNLRLRCGALVSPIDIDGGLRVERSDVLAAVGREHGFDDPLCGFLVFVPHAFDCTETPYIEIETRRGEVGYRRVPAPKLDGMAAIRRLLECFDVRFLDVPRTYDRVIGPAVEMLNQSRLKRGPRVTQIEFGTPPPVPEFSVIIPLYGRIDFVEYQIALFSAHPPSHRFEFIYVLDDPPKQREAQFLFASVYQRFGLPFRALLLDRNVGFAPANNIGLRHAHGRYVCFLNSDAFPGTPDWLERLAARLDAHPDLGAVGPLLLYEDGSIQHQGMSFRKLDEFGGWHFGNHPGKGMQPDEARGMRRCISITGACMVLERALAERLHGFDEAYAIGDFEDSDLCLRLYRMGLASAVDLDVHLFHLERKSQAGSAANWRMNLTLYNAWFHERRWARAIEAHPQALGPVPYAGEAERRR